MRANKPQMFRRKPAAALLQSQNEKHDSSLRSLQRTKALSFTNKICEINIYPSPTKKSSEESLAYSIQLTPITTSQKKKNYSKQMQQVTKHLYGTMKEINQKCETENEQSLLLDYKQILQDQNKHKILVTPNTNYSYSSNDVQNQQEQCKQSQKICSNFQLLPTQYKLSFYYLNKTTIKVQYIPSKSGLSQKIEISTLIARLRKIFNSQPLLLFDFISNTLQKWSQYSLKMFLLSKNIKFAAEEITIFKAIIEQMSSTLNMHQIAQTLFITSDEDYQMVMNSQKIKMSNLLSPQENSFLKLYVAIIRENYAENIRHLLAYIEAFFRKVI